MIRWGLEFVAYVAVVGAAGAGLAALVRALPWAKELVKRKPLSCAVCVPGHATWITMLVARFWPGIWYGWHYAFIVYFAALAVAVYLYRQVYPPEPDFG